MVGFWCEGKMYFPIKSKPKSFSPENTINNLKYEKQLPQFLVTWFPFHFFAATDFTQ